MRRALNGAVPKSPLADEPLRRPMGAQAENAQYCQGIKRAEGEPGVCGGEEAEGEGLTGEKYVAAAG